MKKIVIWCLALLSCTSCYHEYLCEQRANLNGVDLVVPVYRNTCTGTPEIKLGNKYYPVTNNDKLESGMLHINIPTEVNSLRAGSSDSVVVDMWKYTTVGANPENNHFTRTIPVVDGRIDISLFTNYSSCVGDHITLYNYQALSEGFSFETRDEYPDDPNALTIYNSIIITPKY